MSAQRSQDRPPETPMEYEDFERKAAAIGEPKIEPPAPIWHRGRRGGIIREPLSGEAVAKILNGAGEITGRACQEGWICGLYDFVRDRHRLPRSADEFGRIKSASEWILGVATGRIEAELKHRQLANAFLDRREKLSKEFG